MHYTTALTSTLAVAGSLIQSASATYYPPPAAASSPYGGSTSSNSWAPYNSTGGSVKDMVTVVTVGKDGQLAFDPPNVKVPVGSHVQFQFYPMNHSVVQADFSRPCVPIQNVDRTTKGFFSGFMPAAVAAPDNLVFDVQVTSSDPIWFYCSQDTHCQGGMVGAINADDTGSKTIGAFKAAAMKAPWNLTPGVMPPGALPPNGTSPTGGSRPPPPPASTGGSSTGGGSSAGGSSGTSTGGSSGGASQQSPPPPTGGAARIASMGLGLTFAAAVFML